VAEAHSTAVRALEVLEQLVKVLMAEASLVEILHSLLAEAVVPGLLEEML
jgi:hypothetical protein